MCGVYRDLTAEKDPIRDVTMPALDRFIDELLRLDPVIWLPPAAQASRKSLLTSVF